MGDTGTRVDDGTRERSVLNLGAGPGGSKGEDSLHGDVQTGDVERLEHNLGGGLTVLWRIQRLGSCQQGCLRRPASTSYGLSQEEVVVLGLDTQVLEYRVGPEALHEILSGISIIHLVAAASARTQLSIWPCRMG